MPRCELLWSSPRIWWKRRCIDQPGRLALVLRCRYLPITPVVKAESCPETKRTWGIKFPGVRDSIAALEVQEVVIDGEIVALDEKGRSSFQLLQGFDIGEQRPPIVFYAFDLLRLNGKDVQNLPIQERKTNLEELLKNPPGVIRYSVSFTKDIPELLDRAQKLGLEGLIGKRCGSKYEAGRGALGLGSR
jgi:ATP-dependent DNA ligase